MTDNAQPTTEAGRRLLETSFLIDWMEKPMEECEAMVAAIEAEARAESAAKVRALPAGITQHTCWDNHEGPNGGHLDGSPCRDDPQEFVSRDAVLAALDADAPAETVWFTGAPGEACIGDPSHQYHSHDEDAPEPRSAEPEGLDAETLARALGSPLVTEQFDILRRYGWLDSLPVTGMSATGLAHCIAAEYARLRGEQRHGWTNASPEEWDRANAAVQLTCLCEGEFPIHCGPECQCQIHHSSNSGGAPEIAPDEHLEADYEDRYVDDSGL